MKNTRSQFQGTARSRVFLAQNQLDLVIVPERSEKYVIQNDRVKFVLDEEDRLGMVRIEELTEEEYRILKESFERIQKK